MQKKIKTKTKKDSSKEDKDLAQISIGDITIVSRKGLLACRNEIKGLLKDENIKNYLGLYSQKKIIGPTPSYID